MSTIGRNLNVIDIVNTSIVPINSLNAVQLLPANANRIYAVISLMSGVTIQEAYIREYDFEVDDIKQGELLVRHLMANDNLYHPVYRTMADNPYIGPISGISDSGIILLSVIEGLAK